MKYILPRYTASFECACTAREVAERVSEFAQSPSGELVIEQPYLPDAQNIILRASTGDYLYYNSFLPIVNIDLNESDGKTAVSILFELKKGAKIWIVLLSVFALLFAAALSAFLIAGQLISPLPLLFPLAMLIFVFILSNIGLYFSSKDILSTLFSALNGEDDRTPPLIRKPKRIV